MSDGGSGARIAPAEASSMVDDQGLLQGGGVGPRSAGPERAPTPDEVDRQFPPVVTIVFDRDLRCTGVGGCDLAQLGWDPDGLLGRRLDEVGEGIAGDGAASLGAHGRAALAGESRSFRHRGSRRPHRVNQVDVIPVHGEDGTVEAGLIVVRDVTDDLAQQDELRRDVQRLRQLADASADMQALYDPQGVYLEVSGASRTLFGWDPQQLIGTSAYALFHPDDVEAIRRSHAAVIAASEAETITYRLRCADGTYRWVEARGHRVTDPVTGQVTAIQCTTRDITGRRAAEQRLLASEQRFRVAMVNAPIGMALVGLEGRCLEVNGALCRILGRTVDELRRLAFPTFTHPDDLVDDLGLLEDLLAGRRSTYELEKRYLRPDGTVVPCALHVALVRDAEGAPEYFISQIMDLTDRKAEQARSVALHAELERSNEELARFASTASHDLRSPLATARGLLDLLPMLLGDGLDPDAHDVLGRARRQLERLTDTVDGLLELARVGSVDPVPTVIDPRVLLGEVLDGLEPTIVEVGAVVVPGELAPIVGDRRQVSVVLQNLLHNALRYRHPERPLVVHVATQRASGYWTLSVEDNGRGVPTASRDRLFEPFVRGDPAASANGAGIGLATCRRIAERHGGTLEVHHLEGGTRFVLTVPVPAPSPDAGTGN